MSIRHTTERLFRWLGRLEGKIDMVRQSITDLEAKIAALKADYDARFATVGTSGTDTQALIDAAVAKAVAAKETEDDAAFSQAAKEISDIMASHVATIGLQANPAPAAPAPGIAVTATVAAPTTAGTTSVPVIGVDASAIADHSTVDGPGIQSGTTATAAPSATGATLTLSQPTTADHTGDETVTITSPPPAS